MQNHVKFLPERIYIERMLEQIGFAQGMFQFQLEKRPLLTLIVYKSQQFVRETTGEPWAVSLRDVARVRQLIRWYREHQVCLAAPAEGATRPSRD
jgi:hypothetical protein